jgi:hypothetical protein
MPKVPRRIRVPPLTEAIYARGVKAQKNGPFDVIRARYDRVRDTLDLTLRNGIAVSFPRKQIREIARAKPANLTNIEIQPGGDGITVRRLNVDIYVPGLLAEELGSIFAKALGRKTRGKTSRKKAAASRLNGRKGGRPKKSREAA